MNQANGRLRASNMRVRILLRNERLYLRATLPPKPGSGKKGRYRQEISLGSKATVAGVKYAENEARKLAVSLDCKEFSWEPYLQQQEALDLEKTVGDWLLKIEEHYWLAHRLTEASQTTWKKDYERVFRELPRERALTVEVLQVQGAVSATEAGSRLRQRFCVALGALAKFAEVEFDSKLYRGKYLPKRLSRKELPGDGAIAEWFWRLRGRNEAWGWVFGMMACYGVRPSEVWLLDYDGLREGPGLLTVLGGEDGEA